ncbi:MAG TPA: hypothetical protein PKC21_01150 [Oligoflexia bacterium]|nr:hypothetical protein [Oligoflexia bacterium]HMR23936.1 hypothetical protein [Oligoflexia bacterium]
MLISVPQEILRCLNTLTNHGYEAYIVGGAIRDSLLNKLSHDWDIACSANPEQLRALFTKGVFKNKKYGTISLFKQPLSIEITPFRVESNYKNNRHPQHVSFGQSLKQDLMRRDFTINAMAYDVSARKLIDPHHGRKDLEAKLLNTVGSAKDRLSEDYLRILRAARFINMLNFNVSKDIIEAAKDLSSKITSISQERIGAEFLKIFAAESSVLALDFCNQTNLSPYIFSKNVNIDAVYFSRKLPQGYQAESRVLKIYECDFDKTRQIIQNWSWPKNSQQKLKHIQLCLSYYEASKNSLSAKHDFLLNLAPLQLIDWQDIYEFLYNCKDIHYINELQTMKNQENLFAISDLSLNGKDIQILFNNPKKDYLIGKILNELTEKVRLKHLSNHKQDLLAYTIQKYSEHIDKSE